MKEGEVEELYRGGYIFEGQVYYHDKTYVKGDFVSQGSEVQALTATSILVFKEVVEGLKVQDERMSVFNH